MSAPPLKDVTFYFCVSVCLSGRSLTSYERILMKSSGGVGRGPRNKRLDFGGDQNHDPDPEFV